MFKWINDTVTIPKPLYIGLWVILIIAMISTAMSAYVRFF